MVVDHGVESIGGRVPSYCPGCVWSALILSLGLHAAIASVFWTTADTRWQAAPGAPVLLLELATFGHASAGGPAQAANVTATPPTPAPVPTTSHAPPPVRHQPPPVVPRPAAAPRPKPPRKRVRDPAPPGSARPEATTRGAADRPARQAGAAAPGPSAPLAGAVARAPDGDPGSATAAASGAARASAERAYLAGLRRAIAQAQRYPAESRRRAESGVATVSFVIDAGGAIDGVRLAGSSGAPLLDQAAVEALRRLGRYQPIPSVLGRRSWALRVPIRFDLRD